MARQRRAAIVRGMRSAAFVRGFVANARALLSSKKSLSFRFPNCYLSWPMRGLQIKTIIAGGVLLTGCIGFAQEKRPPGAWDFDSITPTLTSTSSANTGSSQAVYDVLVKMMTRWNAHDLDGYLECFWKSPELVDIVDSDVKIGWQELHDSYKIGFINPEEMGVITPTRIQVRLVKDDLAFALTRWTITFPRSTRPVIGIDSNYLQKFDDGWKVISAHTSTAEM
jgi:uncharacterized protein (TIGR02246 family)